MINTKFIFPIEKRIEIFGDSIKIAFQNKNVYTMLLKGEQNKTVCETLEKYHNTLNMLEKEQSEVKKLLNHINTTLNEIIKTNDIIQLEEIVEIEKMITNFLK